MHQRDPTWREPPPRRRAYGVHGQHHRPPQVNQPSPTTPQSASNPTHGPHLTRRSAKSRARLQNWQPLRGLHLGYEIVTAAIPAIYATGPIGPLFAKSGG